MGFLGDMWQGVKNFESAMNPIQRAKDFIHDPLGSIASTATGLPGAIVNAVSGSSDAKTWEDTPWYDRMATTIKSKAQGVMNTPLEWMGLDDYTNTSAQDHINQLKYKPTDDAVTSFDAGLSTALGEELKASKGGSSDMGAQPQQGSLGRAVALEQDPVLDQPIDNYNNFSF